MPRRRDRILLPFLSDCLRDAAGETLFAVPVDHPGDLGLRRSREPLRGVFSRARIHPHIKRTVEPEREPALRVINLRRRHTDIHQHAVHAVNAEASDNLLHLREIRPANSNPRVIGKPFGDGRDSVRVLIDGNQPACGKPLGDGL